MFRFLQTVLFLTDSVFDAQFACFDESVNLYQWIKPCKSYITVYTMQKQNINWFATVLRVVIYFSYTNKNLHEICQYNKANHHFKYCSKPIHILFLHCVYCNIAFTWLNPLIKVDSFIKTSKLCIKNRICQKQNSLQQYEHSPYFWYPTNSAKLRKNKQVVQQDSAKGIRTN